MKRLLALIITIAMVITFIPFADVAVADAATSSSNKLLSESYDYGKIPELTVVGDKWPCTEATLQKAWKKYYPLMCKVLGPVDESFYDSGLTWKMTDETLSHRVNEQFPKTNTIEMGIPVAAEDTTQCIAGLIHETGHMWLQKNGEGINYDGQWLWEASTNLVELILNNDGYFDGNIGSYGDLLEVAGEALNGTVTDGDKAYRSFSDQAGAIALYYMDTVLSNSGTLSYWRKVNELRNDYAKTHNDTATICDADMKSILTKAANGKKIDGMNAGDWLYSKAVSNINGKDGTYLSVFGNYADNLGKDARIHLYAFNRSNGKETGLKNQSVTVTAYDYNNKAKKSATFKLEDNGVKDKVKINGLESSSFTNNSAVEFVATMNYNGKTYTAKNYTIVLSTAVTAGDSRMFFVLTDENGDIVNTTKGISVTGGTISSLKNGLLIVTATRGKAVTVTTPAGSYVYSKPYGSRVIPINVGASASGGDSSDDKPSVAKAVISKLTVGKKYAKLTWKKVSGAAGYQVAYKLTSSSKWTYKKVTSTSKKLTKLKSGKTYQLKVRAYKTYNGEKVYGSWSAVKKKKVK